MLEIGFKLVSLASRTHMLNYYATLYYDSEVSSKSCGDSGLAVSTFVMST